MVDDVADTLRGSTGMAEAAKVFESILGGEKPTPQVQPKQKVSAAEEEDNTADELEETPDELEADDEEGDDDDAPPEEDADDEGGSDEDADADADEQSVDAKLALDALVTVKIDGKEEKVKLKEALDGYQRQADYQRKTQSLAEQRKSLEGETSEVKKEREQYSVLLDALSKQLAEVQEPNWEALKTSDPVEYLVQRDAWERKKESETAIAAERERLQNEAAKETVTKIREYAKEENDRLMSAMPTWKNPKVWGEIRPRIVEYGKTVGFSEDELNNAIDHRAILALYKAMQYDGLKAKKKAKTDGAPAPKVAAAGSPDTAPKRVTKLTEAQKRLKKSGSVEDAAKVFELLL